MVYLAGVKQAKLRNFVSPNVELAVDANIIHDGSGYSVTEASISKAGESVADAELTFRVLPFPTSDFGDMMRKRARDLGLMVGA